MKYLIRDTPDHRKVAHIADVASLTTTRPRTACGSFISPKRWGLAEELGEYRVRCIKCERLLLKAPR